MNYLQKLFINSVVDIYSDILNVDLETGECSYIYTENHVMEEIHLPQKWEEAKQMILKSIVPEDHAAVLEKLDTHMTMEAEEDSAFSVEYHTVPTMVGRRAPLWKMNIIIIENKRRKQALIMCRDNSIDMKGHFNILGLRDKDVNKFFDLFVLSNITSCSE